MSDCVISHLRRISLMVMVGTVLCTPVAQAQEQAASTPPSTTPETFQAPTLVALRPDAFLRLLIARNIEIQYSQLNTDVTRYLREGEAALYEPTAFMGLRTEGRNRQRTPDERLQNTFTAGTAILDEKVRNDEFGVRGKLPTGAEVSVSYKASSKTNNLVAQTSNAAFDTEYTSLLNLTLKQPLLRNAGRSITETDRRVAELEHQVALHQLIQQTMKSSIDGLTLYWQLYRAQETFKLRQEALSSTESLLADANARIAAGRMPASAVLELRGVALNREAELARSLQALRETQSKLSTALNLAWSETQTSSTEPQLRAPETSLAADTPALDDMLNVWPPYQIALLRQRQAQTRFNFALNQGLPLVDLVMSYGGTGFNNSPKEARSTAIDGTYPDWYLGINFEIPLGGNQKAQNQFLAQNARLAQSELEIEAIRNSFSNDMLVRRGDLMNALGVFDLSKKEIKLRQSIFENERQRVQIGSGSLSNLIQKQVDVIESRQRMLENQVRFEVAMAIWQYTRGSLLTDHGIEVTSAP